LSTCTVGDSMKSILRIATDRFRPLASLRDNLVLAYPHYIRGVVVAPRDHRTISRLEDSCGLKYFDHAKVIRKNRRQINDETF
jgi:hypothetical protein